MSPLVFGFSNKLIEVIPIYTSNSLRNNTLVLRKIQVPFRKESKPINLAALFFLLVFTFINTNI